MSAAGLPSFARTSLMTHAGHGPHVVHGPYDGFAALQDFLHIAQRQHTLIEPMQMYDVGLLELGQSCDVGAMCRGIDGKQIFSAAAIGPHYTQALGHETYFLQQFAG